MKELLRVVFFIGIAILWGSMSVIAGSGTGTLTGQLMVSTGKPMSGAIVYVYNLAVGPEPSRDRYWRVPDNVMTLDNDGRFTMDLAPGDYCVGAVKRLGPPQIGPPEAGDLFLLSLDGKGTPKKYAIKAGERLDMGVVSGAQPLVPSAERKGITAMEGTVRDSQGSPVEGALIMAFNVPTVIGKPLFVSERSRKDGFFSLRVHEGGTYYLKVRNTYGGGPPRAGAVLDGNKETPLIPITVKTGETTRNVVLKGVKFPGRGPEKE